MIFLKLHQILCTSTKVTKLVQYDFQLQFFGSFAFCWITVPKIPHHGRHPVTNELFCSFNLFNDNISLNLTEIIYIRYWKILAKDVCPVTKQTNSVNISHRDIRPTSRSSEVNFTKNYTLLLLVVKGDCSRCLDHRTEAMHSELHLCPLDHGTSSCRVKLTPLCLIKFDKAN